MHDPIESDGLVLRPTTADDLDVARGLFTHPGFYEHWDSYPKSDEEIAEKFLGRRNPSVECFFVEVDEELDHLQWRRLTVDPDVSNERGVHFWKQVGFIPISARRAPSNESSSWTRISTCISARTTSAREPMMRSAWSRANSAVIGFGTAMQWIPAVRAAVMPDGESSKAIAALAETSSCARAAR